MAIKVFVLLVASVFFAEHVCALDEAFQRLIRSKSLKCTFAKGMAANWQGETVQVVEDSGLGTLHFDAIDMKAKTAWLIGNAGSTDVTLLRGTAGLTFIEQTGIGNFAFTTIFLTYKKNTTEFIAVTSRHRHLIELPVPSQYHGTCTVWD